ncbi:hypothetical protein MMC11_002206, partial [Xylographa trunciseda]|nr:hypothetical protein [Xylographa trunciseda]
MQFSKLLKIVLLALAGSAAAAPITLDPRQGTINNGFDEGLLDHSRRAAAPIALEPRQGTINNGFDEGLLDHSRRAAAPIALEPRQNNGFD